MQKHCWLRTELLDCKIVLGQKPFKTNNEQARENEIYWRDLTQLAQWNMKSLGFTQKSGKTESEVGQQCQSNDQSKPTVRPKNYTFIQKCHPWHRQLFLIIKSTLHSRETVCIANILPLPLLDFANNLFLQLLCLKGPVLTGHLLSRNVASSRPF